jgi:hypothetical protein
MGLAMRQVDLERLDRALTTILSPLAHQRCDDWRVAVESSVGELLDGDHVVFGLPRAGVPMHIHAMNVGGQPQRAIQTLFGRLPDLPSDPWLQKAEHERLQSKAEVWSRIRAFWRATAGEPAALRRSPFLGEVLTPGHMHDSENIDWPVADGHTALCISYSNVESSIRSRRTSPRHAAGALLRLLLPALKVGVTMRLAHDRDVQAQLAMIAEVDRLLDACIEPVRDAAAIADPHALGADRYDDRRVDGHVRDRAREHLAAIVHANAAQRAVAARDRQRRHPR